MITRLLILMFVALLAAPVATLTQPTDTGQSPWSNTAVAAKGKKHKKHQRPRTRTVTRTERQTVTQTFSSTTPLTIVDEDKANPYPATIAVSGMPNGVITDINLLLTDLTHTTPRDIDLLLSASNGRRVLVMSDVGNVSLGQEDAVVNIALVLDDEAGTPLPVSEQLSSGTFQPTNHLGAGDTKADAFAAPAPAPDGSVALSTFDGADPNGTWQLWVMDDVGGDEGTIAGWALQVTAEVDVQVQERVKAKKKGKGHKKGKR